MSQKRRRPNGLTSQPTVVQYRLTQELSIEYIPKISLVVKFIEPEREVRRTSQPSRLRRPSRALAPRVITKSVASLVFDLVLSDSRDDEIHVVPSDATCEDLFTTDAGGTCEAMKILRRNEQLQQQPESGGYYASQSVSPHSSVAASSMSGSSDTMNGDLQSVSPVSANDVSAFDAAQPVHGNEQKKTSFTLGAICMDYCYRDLKLQDESYPIPPMYCQDKATNVCWYSGCKVCPEIANNQNVFNPVIWNALFLHQPEEQQEAFHRLILLFAARHNVSVAAASNAALRNVKTKKTLQNWSDLMGSELTLVDGQFVLFLALLPGRLDASSPSVAAKPSSDDTCLVGRLSRLSRLSALALENKQSYIDNANIHNVPEFPCSSASSSAASKLVCDVHHNLPIDLLKYHVICASINADSSSTQQLLDSHIVKITKSSKRPKDRIALTNAFTRCAQSGKSKCVSDSKSDAVVTVVDPRIQSVVNSTLDAVFKHHDGHNKKKSILGYVTGNGRNATSSRPRTPFKHHLLLKPAVAVGTVVLQNAVAIPVALFKSPKASQDSEDLVFAVADPYHPHSAYMSFFPSVIGDASGVQLVHKAIFSRDGTSSYAQLVLESDTTDTAAASSTYHNMHNIAINPDADGPGTDPATTTTTDAHQYLLGEAVAYQYNSDELPMEFVPQLLQPQMQAQSQVQVQVQAQVPVQSQVQVQVQAPVPPHAQLPYPSPVQYPP
jgi:hypothetical protein